MGARFSSILPERRWLLQLVPLLVALFYAPLAFGGNTPATVAILDGIYALSFLGWLILLVIERRLPKFSLWCWIPLAIILVHGFVHWANPKSVFYEVFWVFNPTETRILWLPGTADRAATQEVVLHLLALLAAFLVILDACSHSRIRWLFLQGLAISGFMIALIGITQKAGGAEAMLWVEPDPLKYGNKLFFAAFRYHANAASFLNLCWPAALVVYLRERDAGRGGLAVSIWATVLVITVIGVFVNTSKAGQVVAGLGILIALLRFRKSIFVGSKVVMVVSGVLLLGLLAVLAMPAFSMLEQRWSKVSASSSFGGRIETYTSCLKMIPDSGVYGFGPGTFRYIFPFYQEQNPDRMVGEFFWHHAHQDYLQTILEWGIIGACAWFTFFAAGMVRGFASAGKSLKHQRTEYSTSGALLAMIMVLTHALVDFPFQIPALQLPVAVYMAILFARSARRKTKRPA